MALPAANTADRSERLHSLRLLVISIAAVAGLYRRPLSVIARMAANLTSLPGRSTSLRPDTSFFFSPFILVVWRISGKRWPSCSPPSVTVFTSKTPNTDKHTHTCTPAQSCMASCVSNWANVFENAVQCLDELRSVCRVCPQRLPRINRGVNVSPATGVDICRHIQILAFACTGF